ncbi:MAG: DsbA family protein [Anaerolineales bacterium]|nr:DsbA family protein [Anaerolineales bacterium]
MATGAGRRIKEEYINAGKSVRLEFRHFIVIDGNRGGNESRRAAEASECAREQGRFWQYHAILFANAGGEGAGNFRDARLKAFAERLGLDQGQFNSCLDSGRYAAAVREDEALARSLGVDRTPTVFINGQRVTNPIDFEEYKTRIDALLGP